MGDQIGEGPAVHVRVSEVGEIPAALDDVGLSGSRPVVVLVGGAGGMGDDDLTTLAEVIRNDVLPRVDQHGAVVIDGGTDSGVMRLMGRARHAAGDRFPLVGVAAAGTVIVGGVVPPEFPDAAELEPHHSHVVLVPGTDWGAEAPWIAEVAGVVAGDSASVTLLVNGGKIAFDDVERSLDSGRPVVVLAGSGRTADAIADAHAGRGGDARTAKIAASPLVSVAHIEEGGAVAAAIEAALARAGTESA
jgi:hypothetical protein